MSHRVIVGLVLEFQGFLEVLGGFRRNWWRSLVLLACDIGLLLVKRGRLLALRCYFSLFLRSLQQCLVRARHLWARIVQKVRRSPRALRC